MIGRNVARMTGDDLSKLAGKKSCKQAGSSTAPQHLMAGFPRTLVLGLIFPSAAIATAMHYNADVRKRVNQVVPGSTNALSKLTGADYDDLKSSDRGHGAASESKQKETEIDNLPELLTRIAKEKTGIPLDKVDSAKESTDSTGTQNGGSNANWGYISSERKDAESSKIGSSADGLRRGSVDGRQDLIPPVDTTSKDAIREQVSLDGPIPDLFSQKRNGAHRNSRQVSISTSKSLLRDQVSLDGPNANSVSQEHAIGNEQPSKIATSPKHDSASDQVPLDGQVADSTESVADSKLHDSIGKVSSTASTTPPAYFAQESDIRDGVHTGKAVKSMEDKLAIIFGREKMDEKVTDGKDVIDTSVYKKPDSVEWSFGRFRKSSSSGSKQVGEQVALRTTNREKEIAALRAELESQAKWDAVRIQEAIRAQSLADKKAATAEAAAVSKHHQNELEKVRKEASQEAQRIIEAKTKELQDEMMRSRDEEVKQKLALREKTLRESVESEFLERERIKSEERRGEIMALKATVTGLKDHFAQIHDRWIACKSASGIAASAFSLRDAVEGSQSFEKELLALAQQNDLGKAIADAIPQDIRARGVATLDELRSSFRRVSREGLKAALVPAEEVGNLWSHALASIVSRLKVSVDETPTTRRSKPRVKTDEDRIRQAEKYLSTGDLGHAVQSLDGLAPLPAEIMSDWVAEANARISVGLAARTLLADAIVSQHTLVNAKTSLEA